MAASRTSEAGSVALGPWLASGTSGGLPRAFQFWRGTAFRPFRSPLALPGAWPLDGCGLTRGLLSRCFRQRSITEGLGDTFKPDDGDGQFLLSIVLRWSLR